VALNASHINTEVTLAGWVQKIQRIHELIDLRDRYGITQLILTKVVLKNGFELAKTLGREFVIVKGTVIEREAKKQNIPTGEIEILVTELTILNAALTPPSLSKMKRMVGKTFE
jgi:aspartyl-tRNA synthetase